MFAAADAAGDALGNGAGGRRDPRSRPRARVRKAGPREQQQTQHREGGSFTRMEADVLRDARAYELQH